MTRIPRQDSDSIIQDESNNEEEEDKDEPDPIDFKQEEVFYIFFIVISMISNYKLECLFPKLTMLMNFSIFQIR